MVADEQEPVPRKCGGDLRAIYVEQCTSLESNETRFSAEQKTRKQSKEESETKETRGLYKYGLGSIETPRVVPSLPLSSHSPRIE